MATALITPGQVKDLSSAIIEAIPTDLPLNIAQDWIGRKTELGNKIRGVLYSQELVLPDIN